MCLSVLLRYASQGLSLSPADHLSTGHSGRLRGSLAHLSRGGGIPLLEELLARPSQQREPRPWCLLQCGQKSLNYENSIRHGRRDGTGQNSWGVGVV